MITPVLFVLLPRTSPDGKTHSSDEYSQPGLKKQNYSYLPPTSTRNSALLNITRLNIFNNGKYFFYCSESILDRICFHLHVGEEPKAKVKVLDQPFEMFVEREEYEFKCQATGYPEIKKIIWQICNEAEDDCHQKIYKSDANSSKVRDIFDQRGRPVAGIGHYFHTLYLSVRNFQNFGKQNKFQVRIVIATGGTVGLANRIINDTRVFL